MKSLDERSRLAGHVLLDMISIQNFNGPASAASGATRTAFERLNEVDAVTATRDDETETTTIESTALLTGAGALIVLLMEQVQRQGFERDAVIVALRETLDELFGDPQA